MSSPEELRFAPGGKLESTKDDPVRPIVSNTAWLTQVEQHLDQAQGLLRRSSSSPIPSILSIREALDELARARGIVRELKERMSC